MCNDYASAVKAGLEGLKYASTGVCPGCPQCQEDHGYDSAEEFETDWQEGRVCDEPHFSHGGCGICSSLLGGDRHVWHWVDEDGGIMHEDDACTDCVCYMAKGDLPEDWE